MNADQMTGVETSSTTAVIMNRSDKANKTTGRWPDFIIIGAMKAGTTTLYNHLDRHPSINMSNPKEPQYFSRTFDEAGKEAWYKNLFANATDGQLCGEASACYTRSPHFGDVAHRLSQKIPQARFLYVIRHPVDRCYSHYRHVMQEWAMNGKASISLEEAVNELPEILDTSLYLKQLEQYLQHFGRDQIHVLTFDNLTRNAQDTLAEVQRFLCIEESDLLKDEDTHANQWGDRMARRKTRDLIERVRHLPLLSTIIGLIPKRMRTNARSRLLSPAVAGIMMRRQVSQHQRDVKPLSNDMRSMLLDRFAEPNRDLESFLGYKLPQWSE